MIPKIPGCVCDTVLRVMRQKHKMQFERPQETQIILRVPLLANKKYAHFHGFIC